MLYQNLSLVLQLNPSDFNSSSSFLPGSSRRHFNPRVHPLLPIWGWVVVVAAGLAGCSKQLTRQQCFPTPHGGPQGAPELAGICIYALQQVLGLPWCVHPVGTAKSTTRGILIRCQHLLKWLIWTPRSSSSIWSSFWMSVLLTLSLRLSPATLGRTLISPPRIGSLVPWSLPYCTQYCNIVVCKFISSHPSSWQKFSNIVCKYMCNKGTAYFSNC